MPSSSWALQQALYAAVTGSAPLAALIGPPRVYDDVPQGAAFPYLTLGQSTLRDWSTGTDDAEEHTLTLHVWSRAGGRREMHEVMDVLRVALHDQPLALAGHRLVNIRHEISEARRDPDGETYHGIVRFRAVTEPV
jgi:hypothetical protein